MFIIRKHDHLLWVRRNSSFFLTIWNNRDRNHSLEIITDGHVNKNRLIIITYRKNRWTTARKEQRVIRTTERIWRLNGTENELIIMALTISRDVINSNCSVTTFTSRMTIIASTINHTRLKRKRVFICNNGWRIGNLPEARSSKSTIHEGSAYISTNIIHYLR